MQVNCRICYRIFTFFLFQNYERLSVLKSTGFLTHSVPLLLSHNTSVLFLNKQTILMAYRGSSRHTKYIVFKVHLTFSLIAFTLYSHVLSFPKPPSEHLTFSDQISSVSKCCCYHIRQLRCIRPYLKFSSIRLISVPSTHHSHYPSPLHSFIPGLSPSFSFPGLTPQIPRTFFPKALNISVFYFFYSPLFSFWFRAVD